MAIIVTQDASISAFSMSSGLDLDSGLELEETAIIDRAGSFPASPALLHVLLGISNILDCF
jgi:hypothetical protein